MDDEVRKVVEEMRKAIAEWRYGKATVYQADMVNAVVDWADRLDPPERLWVRACTDQMIEWKWSSRNPGRVDEKIWWCVEDAVRGPNAQV